MVKQRFGLAMWMFLRECHPIQELGDFWVSCSFSGVSNVQKLARPRLFGGAGQIRRPERRRTAGMTGSLRPVCVYICVQYTYIEEYIRSIKFIYVFVDLK